MFAFAVLRDYSGSVQLVIRQRSPGDNRWQSIRTKLDELPVESVVSVQGILLKRPEKMANPGMETGELEVDVSSLTVLSKAQPMPFLLNAPIGLPQPSEDILLKHRYIQLRQPALQQNLRLRARIIRMMRDFLDPRGFTEIETPLLFKSTPEGAREFLVPSRIEGKSYALPQSPQQFKQMLMIAGFDKYYQIARCFRDEDGRADRQPEFTQLDLEMSFVTTEHIMQLTEELIKKIWKDGLGVPIDEPFQRINYHEALARYGSDKPDLRYAFQIEPMSASADGVLVESLNVPSHLRLLALNILERYQADESVLEWKEDRLVVSRRFDDHVGATLLGRVRNAFIEAAPEHHSPEPKYRFLWVENFPLFKRANPSSHRRFDPMHHPFTAPHPDDLHLLSNGPLQVRGQHYDLVLNGHEIGGGSVRIHSSSLQMHILKEVMGMEVASLQQFAHLLQALSSGAPPHGGIALGIDRLIALALETKNIRDVIAFPKNGQGMDLCVNAPS